MNENKSHAITGVRASLYSRLMSLLGAGQVYTHIHSLLAPKTGEHILDVGCGTGTFLKLLRDTSGALLDFTGMDISADMLKEARKNAVGISFFNADASKLPFESESFDAVVSILTLHHMPHDVKKGAIREMARVVKRNGRVIIADLFHASGKWGSRFRFWFNFHSYTKGNWEFIVGEMKDLGFSMQKEGTIRGFIGYIIANRL